MQTSHGESQNVGSGTTIDTDTTRATVWGSWVKFDFVKKEQEDLEKAGITGNRYVAKWLKQPFIKEMCANPLFHSFFNHKDLKKVVQQVILVGNLPYFSGIYRSVVHLSPNQSGTCCHN